MSTRFWLPVIILPLLFFSSEGQTKRPPSVITGNETFTPVDGIILRTDATTIPGVSVGALPVLIIRLSEFKHYEFVRPDGRTTYVTRQQLEDALMKFGELGYEAKQ